MIKENEMRVLWLLPLVALMTILVVSVDAGRAGTGGSSRAEMKSSLPTINANGSENWTEVQKEVWAVVQSYTEASHERDAERYLSYWHPDFLGWYNSGHDKQSRPTNKAERSRGIEQYFGATRSLEYTLEPMGMLVIAGGL